MAQDNSGQNNAGKPLAQDRMHDQAQDQSAAVPAPNDQTVQAASVLDGAGDQSVGAELLHAALALPPDALAHVELTLDQLGNTVDLFDVPPFDYGDDAI
jgi:hypothetical protein